MCEQVVGEPRPAAFPSALYPPLLTDVLSVSEDFGGCRDRVRGVAVGSDGQEKYSPPAVAVLPLSGQKARNQSGTAVRILSIFQKKMTVRGSVPDTLL